MHGSEQKVVQKNGTPQLYVKRSLKSDLQDKISGTVSETGEESIGVKAADRKGQDRERS